MKLPGIVGTFSNGNLDLDMTGVGDLINTKPFASVADYLVDNTAISSATSNIATVASTGFMKEHMDTLANTSKVISSAIPDLGD